MSSQDSGQSASSPFRVVAAVLGVAVIGWALYAFVGGDRPAPRAPDPAEGRGIVSAPEPPKGAAAEWDRVSRIEELVLGFDEKLAEQKFAVKNLEFPDDRSRKQFFPIGLTIEDLDPSARETHVELTSIGTVRRSIAPGPLRTDVTLPELTLWRGLLDEVEFFEHVKFQVKKGDFVADSDPEEFEAQVVFAARARMKSGELASFKASPKVRWRLLRGGDSGDADSWRIVKWRTGRMEQLDVAEPLFREVLDEAVTDPAALDAARLSVHERLISEQLLADLAREEFERPYELFRHTAVSKHPGVSVVDVDQDGFDDVYLVTRWGKNQFFRNRGDGTFEEVSAELGLDVDGFSNAALFADFDNDGDPDLFLAKSAEPSAYLVNEDGRFVDRTAERVTGGVPALVSSLSAVDYDGDGLLDLYAATYGIQTPLKKMAELMPPADYQEFDRRLKNQDENRFTDVSGPPNVLLRNTGGGFEVVRRSGALRDFRNTYQATWADYDDDGDPDVYLANDFAPDTMVRNDGEAGFVDVSAELGISQMGFGMGATWGDYDRDGRQDLYVANMYSKAGNRITGGLSYLDPRFREGAQGNYLYRNDESGFQLVSGPGDDQMHVYQAGWAWGSHFFDADNDGFLDLFSLAGFYTAPREVAKVGDT